MADLSVHLGRLALDNPILVASGTFGYAREMESLVDFKKLGGVVPKTVTQNPRAGNPPPRTCETTAGLLNAIGLDNDGLEYFLTNHLPYLRNLPTKIIGNIAGKTEPEFLEMASRIEREKGLAALELNLSCPNVSGGVDFAIDPEKTARVIRGVREVCSLPIIAKLTPNVTDVPSVAQAAAPDLMLQLLGRAIQDELEGPEWLSASGPCDFNELSTVHLTSRQLQVLGLIAQGLTNRQIADRLGIIEATAKAHVSAIFRELGVTNRTQALLKARRLGL